MCLVISPLKLERAKDCVIIDRALRAPECAEHVRNNYRVEEMSSSRIQRILMTFLPLNPE